MSSHSEYGDTNETAAEIKISPSYLNKARVTGDGPPYIKLGKAVRYHLPTVRAWVNARTFQSTSDHDRKVA